MTIAVDFDGTIVEHRYPAIGREIPFAIDALKLLCAHHKVILWTVREGALLDEAVEYCRERGLRFYAINKNYPEEKECHEGYSRKPTSSSTTAILAAYPTGAKSTAQYAAKRSQPQKPPRKRVPSANS